MILATKVKSRVVFTHIDELKDHWNNLKSSTEFLGLCLLTQYFSIQIDPQRTSQLPPLPPHSGVFSNSLRRNKQFGENAPAVPMQVPSVIREEPKKDSKEAGELSSFKKQQSLPGDNEDDDENDLSLPPPQQLFARNKDLPAIPPRRSSQLLPQPTVAATAASAAMHNNPIPEVPPSLGSINAGDLKPAEDFGGSSPQLSGRNASRRQPIDGFWK